MILFFKMFHVMVLSNELLAVEIVSYPLDRSRRD